MVRKRQKTGKFVRNEQNQATLERTFSKGIKTDFEEKNHE